MSDTSRAEFEAWITSPDSPVLAGVEWASLIVERYERCWQASRAAALEEAAKACENRRDLKEAELSRKRVDEAMKDEPDAALMHAMRHHTTVTLVNAELSRAAKAIRALTAPPNTSIQPPSIDASSGRVDSIDAEGSNDRR